MKFYYGEKVQNYTKRTKETILKGGFRYKGIKQPYFTEIHISGYSWNATERKWFDYDEFIKYKWKNYCCSARGDSKVPRTFKAFRRYVINLNRVYNFPKGTVIQLSGRINGIGIFCII